MLYSFIKLNSTANNQIDIEKSILFNYCDSKIRQHLPNFKENKILIDFVTQILVVVSKILNIKKQKIVKENCIKYLKFFISDY